VAESWGLDVSGRFVRACRGEEKPYCTGADALKSLEVILAAEKSAQTGKSVKVKK
jgi:predicted dehydrogenase